MKHINLPSLIAEHFDLEGIRVLCTELGVDYDELRGETKSGKVNALITHMQQLGRSDELLRLLHQKRPSVNGLDPSILQPVEILPEPAVLPASKEADPIRASVWNALYESLWSKKTFLSLHKQQTPLIEKFSRRLWADFFKKPIDSRPKEPAVVFEEIRSYFFSCNEAEFYNYVEFILNYWNDLHHYEPTLINEAVNRVLKREGTGLEYVPRYESRLFIGGSIVKHESDFAATEEPRIN